MQRGFATGLRGVFAGVFVPFCADFVRIFMPRFWASQAEARFESETREECGVGVALT